MRAGWEKLRITGLLIIILLISFMGTCSIESSGEASGGWVKTPVFRVLMKSTADWARIMFDDQEGMNTNGIRLYEVKSYGWIMGDDEDDIIDVGEDLTWYDILYNGTSTVKTGDIVAFFKQNNDFDYTEMYADLVFEVDESKDQIYIFLMVAGQGTTTFELINKETGAVVWRDIITGIGGTQHIQRFIPAKLFVRSTKVESITVLSLALITVFIAFIFNMPSFRRCPRSGTSGT
ncbi:MAG: hypothetical protein QW238_04930 [Candidatus Bathyarchaeia archaeon]